MPHRLLPRLLLDRRGVALPLALLGLVTVSIMVTTILLTSSTQTALSGAQRDATRDLYAVEGGLQAYIASNAGGSTLAPGTGIAYTAPGSSVPLTINVLEARVAAPVGAPMTAGPTFFYTVSATPTRGGRTVVASIRLSSTVIDVDFKIEAGATFGGDTQLGGSSQISNQTDQNLCAGGGTAASAVRLAQGAALQISGNKVDIQGGVITDSRNAQTLSNYVLNGNSVDYLATFANIKFAAGEFNGKPNTTVPRTSKYNWGCPLSLGVSCNVADSSYYPTVMIDASNGGVTLNGDYGQGMLIIRNGDLSIQGGFTYKGIILVEGGAKIRGSQSGIAKIEGALIGTSLEIDATGAIADETDDNSILGNAVIRYNTCAIAQAEKALSQNATPVRAVATRPVFNWFEVVR